MFRLTYTLRALNVQFQPLTPTNANLQTLRWHRKPRWIPTAKSKVFKVPPRIIAPPEEGEEMKRLTNNYKTQIKSIRRFLTYKYATWLRQTIDTELHVREFKEDFAKCDELNNQWNAEVKKQREERLQNELESNMQIALERLEERQRINKARHQESEELVREQKLLAGTFITKENLEEAIEKAVANPVDYNFSIYSDGSKILGRETVPDVKPDKISVKQ